MPPGRKIIFPVPVFGPVQGPSAVYLSLSQDGFCLRCFGEVGRTYMGQCLLPYFGSFLVLPVVCRLSVLCSLSGLPIVIIPSSWSVQMFLASHFLTTPPKTSYSRLLLFSHSVVSGSLRPHGLQHARLPCP